MPVNRKGGVWDGGYISVDEKGRQTFFIERRVGTQRFHVSTRAHGSAAAHEHLRRFEADPIGYHPAGIPAEEPVVMTDALVLRFWTWSTKARGNTRKHANEMNNRLADWTEDLKGADLRHVTLRDHIKPALEARKTCRQHRIIALKSFYGWLRKEEHLLTHRDDPTIDLPVPVAAPEKHRRRKALERERVTAAFAKMEGGVRDCVLLMTATGWHVTELERFVRSEDSEIMRPAMGEVLAVLVTKHKGGELTRTPLLVKEHVEAAERLRVSREVPRRLNDQVRKACLAAEVKEFTLGVMRHSVATWAIELGASPAEVSEFLGHKDRKTTRQFYIDVSVPTVSVPTIRIVPQLVAAPG